jgi:transposase
MFFHLFDEIRNRSQAQGFLREGKKRKFRFKNRLLSLDASVITLCSKTFDWAHYNKSKGGIKLHLVLDHEGHLPCFASLTEAKVADITAAKAMEFPPHSVLAFDRGYWDYHWMGRLHRGQVFFVTRFKGWGQEYELIEERKLPRNSNVVRDKVIRLCSETAEKAKLPPMRWVTIWDDEKNDYLDFFTNQLSWSPVTIAEIYRERWQIECFFRTLKQLLRVKTFVGTSENAIGTQIWTALIAMLLLKYLSFRSQMGLSLSNLIALLRMHLFTYRDLQQWLDDPMGLERKKAEPPPFLQLELDFGNLGQQKGGT